MDDVLREAPFALLRLQWRVLKPITDVPAMTGMLWSAMWRFAYEDLLTPGEAFCNLGLVPMPADRHRRGFLPGEVLHLGMRVPIAELPRFAQVVARLGTVAGAHGHFVPAETIRLEALHCRCCGSAWPQHEACAVDAARLVPAAARLAAGEGFRLQIVTPLAFYRPFQEQRPGFARCDLDWFRRGDDPLGFLLGPIVGEGAVGDLRLVHAEGYWQDVRYRKAADTKKFLSGFIGCLEIAGRLPVMSSLALLLQQYLGLGRGSSFGSGQFRIAEVADCLPLVPLVPSKALWTGVCLAAARRWELDRGRATAGHPVWQEGGGAAIRDARLRDLALRRLAHTATRAMGKPRSIYFRKCEAPHIQALAITCHLDWAAVGAARWLDFLAAVLPDEPLVAAVRCWQNQGSPGWLMPLLRTLWRGSLRHSFGGDSLDLPGGNWDIAVALPYPGAKQAALRKCQTLLAQAGLPKATLETQILDVHAYLTARKAVA